MRPACLLIAAASLSTALQTGSAVLHAPACLAKPVVMQVAHTDDPVAKQAWLAKQKLPWGSTSEMDGRVVPTDAASSAGRRAAEWPDQQEWDGQQEWDLASRMPDAEAPGLTVQSRPAWRDSQSGTSCPARCWIQRREVVPTARTESRRRTGAVLPLGGRNRPRSCCGRSRTLASQA